MPDSKHRNNQTPSKISKFKRGIQSVSQEKMSIFWEVTVLVVLSKTLYVHVSYSERFPR